MNTALKLQSLNNDARQNLTIAYRILSHLGACDHTYTHLSLRAEDGESFYIYPFGQRFDQVTPDSLIRVDFEGNILEGSEHQYNQTGYVIHGNIYKKRSDLRAIFHLHTPEIVAVSAAKSGLLPISQWALHFYDRISYHNYNSLALDPSLGADMVEDLGQNYSMLMRNHGSLTCGRTIWEAMFYSYHLIQACKAQCAAAALGELIVPDAATCAKTVKDIMNFEDDIGYRDWLAWKELYNKIK